MPIIPVGVVGTVEVQPVNSKFMRPFKTVTIRFGKPMQIDPPAIPRTRWPTTTTPSAGTSRTGSSEIARLSEREYLDEYVPSQAGRQSDQAA